MKRTETENEREALLSKISDLDNNPNIEVEFSPEEADIMGAFKESALSEEAAKDSSILEEGDTK